MSSLAKSRLLVIPTIALMSLAVLSGCGSSNTDSSQGDSSSSAASAPAESSDSGAKVAKAEAPAGYKMVTSSGNNISFAIPEDWVSLDNASLSDEGATKDFLGKLKEDASMTQEQLKTALDGRELLAVAPTQDGKGFTPNLIVRVPVAAEDLPTKEKMAELVEYEGAKPKEYQQIDTPMGPSLKQEYTFDTSSGGTVSGMFIVVPSGNGKGFYDAIAISSADPELTKKVTDAVLESIGKAS